MKRNIKTCSILLICFFIFLPGFVYSEEEKAAVKGETSGNAKIEKELVLQSEKLFLLKQSGTPAQEKDSKDVDNGSDSGKDNNLKNPDSNMKMKTAENNDFYWDFKMTKLQIPWTDKKYSMKIISPNPDIDPEIVMNISKPGTEYSMNIIEPYTKRKTTSYIEPSFGLCPNKFQPNGKFYKTPVTDPVE